MRLKRIKLAGFKSFVDPTNIPFDGDMTAIVGPNGCGKSNVIDAVRWVLGESSAKNLRGDAMTDVIFNGSSARKPVGQCSVELLFDNTSGRIGGEYANYNELSVKRLVTRDAQSFYFLNSTKCRRRDVTDLFLGTGLGPRSYAIIEQGMISKLIESKPQELRVFIEEAAGVSKYKERRKDTITRIKHTQENLTRLDDVRNELGGQIDKLQRQATAAQRYTQLKARQRQLQGEIAALKWLTQTNLIEHSETEIQRLTSELAKFQADQQGDQTQLLVLQTRLAELNDEIAQKNDKKYQLATTISRLEQDHKYAQTRRKQLEADIHDNTTELASLVQALEDVDAQLQASNDTLQSLTPEHELALARQAELAEQLTDAQLSLSTFSQTTVQQAQRYQQAKQDSANGHSQIQGLLSVLHKTQSNIEQVTTEANEISSQLDRLNDETTSAQRIIEEHQGDLFDTERELEQTQMTMSQQQTMLDTKQSVLREYQHEHTQACAALTALNTLQAAQHTRISLPISEQPLFEWLSVLPEDSHWFEHVLAGLNQPTLSVEPIANIEKALCANPTFTGDIWLTSTFTANKRLNTLAELCLNTHVPALFNTIHIDSQQLSTAQALIAIQQYPAGESLLLHSGVWVFHDHIFHTGLQHEDNDGVIARTAQIEKLHHTIDKLLSNMTVLEIEIEQAQQDIASNQQSLAAIQLQQTQQAQAQQHAQQALAQHRFEHQQALKQHAKLGQELTLLTETFAQEQAQLNELNASVEEDAMILVRLEEEQADVLAQESVLRAEVERFTVQSQQHQAHIHQSELALQQAKSACTFLAQNKAKQSEQVTQLQAKLTLSESQLSTLNEPAEVQQAVLLNLLDEQADIDTQLAQLNAQGAEVDRMIKETEQGQQGYIHNVEKLKENIQSQQLALQGHSVRAASIVEQLQQANVSLKDILPTLADDADEQQMQQELDQVTASIGRLGAVNLAAVDEYAIQAERKAYLDQQNEDLCTALDTLENAMRKMDNDTKTRFKATFDQVNHDLKNLFPKVFGGGSAYLELTGDDMLETGVTIMARPPGKKNSTIHLLSGGEKALTALSLVFAIFRLNPAPFCLLDEVDAPLDDANVGRFCKLVSEMSKTVQFIYISHNKIAMEMASHLTGVTMSEPGVSRIVAVDIEEAVAITQA